MNGTGKTNTDIISINKRIMPMRGTRHGRKPTRARINMLPSVGEPNPKSAKGIVLPIILNDLN